MPMSKTLKQFISSSYKELTEQHQALLLNFIRDFLWTAITIEQFGPVLDKTDDTSFGLKSQEFGQLLYPTLVMLSASVGFSTLQLLYRCYYNSKVKEEMNENIDSRTTTQYYLNTINCWLKYAAAAATAIYPWDFGQGKALQLFTRWGVPKNNANWASAVGAGLGEGWVQWLVISSWDLLGECFNAMNKAAFLNKKYKSFGKYTIEGTAQFGISLTIGSIPGAVWYLAYLVGTEYATKTGQVWTTSLLVATAVCLANYLYGISSKRMFDRIHKFIFHRDYKDLSETKTGDDNPNSSVKTADNNPKSTCSTLLSNCTTAMFWPFQKCYDFAAKTSTSLLTCCR